MTERLDLSEFEFTPDLTCEIPGKHQPRAAIRYMVMACTGCHVGRTLAICGDCYVTAIRVRSVAMQEGHLIRCSLCGTNMLPIQYTQFYELRYFQSLSHRETGERGTP